LKPAGAEQAAALELGNSPCTAGSTVPAGNRIPGIAEHALFASFGTTSSTGAMSVR
jgi:hypothetical protein